MINEMRPEITYSKALPTISLALVLNTKNHYEAFVAFANLVVKSHISQLLMKNENEMSFRIEFFKQIVRKHVPKVAKHMEKLDIPYELPFYNWFEFIFFRMFSFELFNRIFDIFLVRGEVIMYEISLAIFKLLERDLLNVAF